MNKKTVMSGMRPTGRLHLGNLWGALKNWVKLQEGYRCYFMVADLHMFTTGYEDTSGLQENVREMVLDWLAAGIDPKRSTIFLQSAVPQHAELSTLLSMITPLSWLENNSTWKEQLQELAKTKESMLRAQVDAMRGLEAAHARHLSEGLDPRAGARLTEQEAGTFDKAKQEEGRALAQERVHESLRTHGFLGYPVLQAADILLYDGELVPVGKDQESHLELAREIARRFNHLYAKGASPVLTEPKPLFTDTPKVPGTDARKMSKSYSNTVGILETRESLKSKVMGMYTDPKKLRAKDPGNPDGCVVFALHKLYSAHASVRETECRRGAIGCVACKQDLLKSLEPSFEEFRRRRSSFNVKTVKEVLDAGSRKAREVAEKTMERVRAAMRLR